MTAGRLGTGFAYFRAFVRAVRADQMALVVLGLACHGEVSYWYICAVTLAVGGLRACSEVKVRSLTYTSDGLDIVSS